MSKEQNSYARFSKIIDGCECQVSDSGSLSRQLEPCVVSPTRGNINGLEASFFAESRVTKQRGMRAGQQGKKEATY
jgi:hypothetical protein